MAAARIALAVECAKWGTVTVTDRPQVAPAPHSVPRDALEMVSVFMASACALRISMGWIAPFSGPLMCHRLPERCRTAKP